MLRNAAFTVLVLASAQAHAGWYAGIGGEKQHLQYDVNGWVDKQLAEPNVKPYLDDLHELGATQTRSIKSNGLSMKGFIGYSFTPRTAVEVGYRKYADMSVQVSEKLAGSGAASGSYEGDSGSIQTTAQGAITGKYTLTAHGLNLSIVQRVYNPVFIRLGVERLTAKTVGTVSGEYSYTYTASVNDESVSGTGADNKVESTRVKSYSKTVPLYGVGADLSVCKNAVLRVEFEKVGTPSTGVSFYGVSAIYKF